MTDSSPRRPADGPIRRRAILTGALGGAAALAGCSSTTPPKGARVVSPPGTASAGPVLATTPPAPETPGTPTPTPTPATAAEVARRATVPALCWHQLREWESSDGEYARTLLICPPEKFRTQLDALADGGWTTIGPDDYLAHLMTGAGLPDKPVLLSFDDSQGSQMTEGLPQLQHRGLTATFFVMTVVLGNAGWMSEDDVRRLHGAGMTVGAHTWDHHRVDRYSGDDWARQLVEPRAALEQLLGAPVTHFAYPYGAWDEGALPHVVEAGYASAYQLADREPSADQPALTLRRSLVTSTWGGAELLDHLDELTS